MMSDKWYGFFFGICALIQFDGLICVLFGNITFPLITGAEWVLSEHPGWQLFAAIFCLFGLVCSIYDVVVR